jgi:uncharacterized protein (TIGR02118 family)
MDMVKLIVLYPRQEGGTFDMAYYREQHLPLARRLLGEALKGVSVEQGVKAGPLPAPYEVVCHMLFESVETLGAALNANLAALGGDIPNYTNVTPVFQVGEVVEG